MRRPPPANPPAVRAAVAGALVAAAALVIAGCGASGPDDVPSPTRAPGSASALRSPSSGVASSSSPAAVRASPSATAETLQTRPPRDSATPTAAGTATRTPPSTGVAGKVVVLNPGHNGGNASHPKRINRQVPAGYGAVKACDTTGTNTDAGYSEHAFAWDVSLRVRRILQTRGVTVVLTRRNDTGVGPCVDERAAIGNRPDVAAVVSIHADGAPASGHGFHVNQASKRPDGASKATANASIQLGTAIHKTLVKTSGLTRSTYIGTDGYYFRSDLAGLNLARRPTTFLELGNMRNADDATLLSSKYGRAQIASAVAVGILHYLKS